VKAALDHEVPRMYEFEAIVILAAAFIIVYMIGGLRNRKLLVRYSRAIKKQLQPKSEFIGFRPLGSSGLRVLCNMKKDMPLSKIEMAVSLVDRENVMHYPLALVTKERDRVTIWATSKARPTLSFEICQKTENPYKKRPAGLALRDHVIYQEGLTKHFNMASSNEARARDVLRDQEFEGSLLRARNFLTYLLVDEAESRIFLTGKLTEESLEPLLEVALASARGID